MAAKPKRGARMSETPSPVAASVFLRSASGKSFRDLAEASSGIDLSPYLPPPSACDAVCAFFEDCGFRVFKDSTGFAVSIQGPPSLFEKVFGIEERRIANVGSSDSLNLSPPEQIRPLIEEILVVPAPELFG